MLKALVVAMGVMIVALLVPLVHFITGPVGPFIGGFVGVAALKDNPQALMARSATLGFLMGLCAAAIAVIAVLATTAFISGSGALFLIPLGVGIYTASLGSLGAMVGAGRA